MNTTRITTAGRRARQAWSSFLAVGMAILFSATALAQAPAAGGAAAAPLSAEELTKLVGPIALYPDDLVAIILPAATSPLQIVQADRYLEKRKADPKLPIDDKWDDPVKSLLNYPDVVKMMSTDLDWTSDLGEAVVTDQGAVLEAVQVFRRQAQAAGNLKSDGKQVVTVEKEVIVIQPADPQVVYVPQYNPSSVVVYGAAPAWGYYPTPYPSYYYPYAPGAAMAAGVIWGAAIGAAWSGNHYGYGGGNNTININNNTNVNRGGNTSVNRGQGGQNAGQWKSNKQPGQVSSSVGKSAQTARAGDARGGAASGGAGGRAGGASASSMDRGGAGAGGASRGGQGGAGAGSMDRGGGGYGGGSRGGASNSAMGGYSSGRQTSMDSSRGASSRGASSGGYSGGGASRGGGGAAPRGGGGGGGRGGGGRR